MAILHDALYMNCYLVRCYLVRCSVHVHNVCLRVFVRVCVNSILIAFGRQQDARTIICSEGAHSKAESVCAYERERERETNTNEICKPAASAHDELPSDPILSDTPPNHPSLALTPHTDRIFQQVDDLLRRGSSLSAVATKMEV
jgi:hypothetical protein